MVVSSTELDHATWEVSPSEATEACLALTEAEADRFLDEVAAVSPRLFRFDGLERVTRNRAVALVRRVARGGSEVEVRGDALDPEWIPGLSDAGITRVSVAADGGDAKFAGHGGLARAMRVLDVARTQGIDMEVRTALRGGSPSELASIGSTVARIASHWAVGPEPSAVPAMDAEGLEAAVEQVVRLAIALPLRVTTSYVPFVVRVCENLNAADLVGRRDERRGVYVRADGGVAPDVSVPLVLGNVRDRSLRVLFDNHPILRALRDPDAVEGKCGRCRYRRWCGGSRVRAYVETGNLYDSDPACRFELEEI